MTTGPGDVCGDGLITGMEQCDGRDLGGATCAGEGFAGGSLSCDGACALDLSACTSCPPGTVYIAGGSFTNDLPVVGTAHVVDGFCLDKYEVTVAQFHDCESAGLCTAPPRSEQTGTYNYAEPGRENHPINGVNLFDADAYCMWIGGYVPDEWQWEWAARGRDEARTYPWGEDAPSCALATYDACASMGTVVVGSVSPGGDSRDGVADLAGNVVEWTSSFYGMQPTLQRVQRGGGWDNPAMFLAAAVRSYGGESGRDDYVGFRCAAAPQ